jgi:hypothetical protein
MKMEFGEIMGGLDLMHQVHERGQRRILVNTVSGSIKGGNLLTD